MPDSRTRDPRRAEIDRQVAQENEHSKREKERVFLRSRFEEAFYNVANTMDGRLVLSQLMIDNHMHSSVAHGPGADFSLGRRSVALSIRAELERIDRKLPAQCELEYLQDLPSS